MWALARWCYRHRVVVVLAWVVALVALGGVTRAVGTAYSDQFTLPGTESTKALNLLRSAFPTQAGDLDQIVWHVDNGTVGDPAIQSRISAMLDEVARTPQVSSVASPYTTAGAAQISRDGRTAYATVTFSKQANELAIGNVQQVIDRTESAREPGLQVELGGQAIKTAQRPPLSSTEAIGLLAAAVILFLAFGSLLAAVLPLLIAVVALGVGLLVVELASHAMSIATVAPTLAALIGLGVGIDYALFIVTRHRNGLREGYSLEESALRALNTSGRAVSFAGATVCIALLGLLVLGLSFLNGMAVGAVVAVVFTVCASITLLPALLGFLGMRVLSRRERRQLAAEGPRDMHATGVWARWAASVQRHPKPLAAAAVLVMVVLSIPALSLRLGASDSGNDPSSTTTRKAYDLLAEGFGPGFNGPLQLVADVKTPSDQAALDQLVARLPSEPGVAAVTRRPPRPGQTVEIVQVVPATSPQSEQTNALLQNLRTNVVPAAEAGTTLQVYVGGTTAIFDDFAQVLNDKLPLFIAVIIALGVLLLLIAFRSFAVPLTAAVMNLLAAAASFGVVVAFFQWGWGSEPLGLGSAGPVEAFLPVIMLAILFGLSMDYQVFLVSRMHEEWVHTGDNRYAVSMGQAATGRVITAAAAIMICVFLSFVFGGQRVIAEFGIGLAAAVLIDAFVLRTVLVPAVMHLLGRANWWLPQWLGRRLPHLSVDPSGDEPVVGTDVAGAPKATVAT